MSSVREEGTGRESIDLLIVGCGGMGGHHLRKAVELSRTRADRRLGRVVVCDPDPAARDRARRTLLDGGHAAPVLCDSLEHALTDHAGELTVALVATPHALHHDHVVGCLEAGLDVFVEKPMVTTVPEAESLLRARDTSGRLLVVGFNGSLSPQIRTAVGLIDEGRIGGLTAIHGSVWQDWAVFTENTWRTDQALSGGGFVFDTGAHLLNTTCDLAGADFAEVAAWLDNRGRDVDIIGSVMARTSTGAMVTLGACGETVESCASEIRVFGTRGLLRTGVWGERLDVQLPGQDVPEPWPVPASTGPWEMFCDVRDAAMPNPSPAELGLRMAKLWDLIKASAAEGGRVMRPSDL